MTLPLVSCLIATYNFAPYLARAIESAVEHDYPQDRLQIVVVDDGSEDDTSAVVQPYLDRITYIRKPNGGLISTVNRLLEEARGDVITLLSGDDVWLPGRVRLHVEQLLSRPDLGLVYSDMRMIDSNDRTLAESFWDFHGVIPLSGRPLAALMRQNIVSGGTLTVRASLRDRYAPIPDFACYEDWWIALRVAQVAEIAYLSAPLYGYRQHAANRHLLADETTVLARLTEEIPFRRWLMTDFDTELVSGPEWFAACNEWAATVREVTQRLGTDPSSLVPITSENRRLASSALRAAGEHLAAGDVDSAARECVRALGNDPFDELAGQAATAVTAALEPVRPPLAGFATRTFVTLAEADELIEDPSLLLAYAEAFSAKDDASLLVLVSEDRIEALAAKVDELGLDTASGADIVGLPVPTGRWSEMPAFLAGRIHAVLSRQGPHGALTVLPRVADHDAARLRAYSRQCWARASATAVPA